MTLERWMAFAVIFSASGLQAGCLETDIGRGTNLSASESAETSEEPPPGAATGEDAGAIPPLSTPHDDAGGAGGTALGGAGGTASAGAGGTALGGAASGGAGGAPAGGAGGTAPGGAGGTASGGAAGMGGSVPAGDSYRYAKLVAKSELAGRVHASVAELELLGSDGSPLPRGAWTVSADTEETEDENAAAILAIDGDAETFWHTGWAPGGVGDSPHPHELVVDLGSKQEISGFTYLPRQTGINGRIAEYEFYLSEDGSNWGAVIMAGSFPDSIALQTIRFR